MQPKRWPGAVLCVACVVTGPVAIAQSAGSAAQATPAATPLLVELFTSEGCSSCPPADRVLEHLDANQPVPGAELIVLSEHVTYWDREGWKDHYSSPQLTDRQTMYVHKLGLSTPYTPQLLVDGFVEFPWNDSAQTVAAIQRAETIPKVPVTLTAVRIEPGNPSVVRGHLDIDGTSAPRDADVQVAVALSHVESQVQSGENSGKHLTHVAVVEQLVKVATLKTGRHLSQDFAVKLPAGTDPANVRIVAFVQTQGLEDVIGAAALDKID
jgi:hypothetical protein